MTVEICLGTAQFGLNYGITNEFGQVSAAGVSNILSLAHQNNIQFLDTARSYGSSEKAIGSNLPHNHKFRFISKLESQQFDCFDSHNVKLWEESFHKTCANLKSEKLDSFLVHSVNDLSKDGSQYLISWLLGLKERGLVERLGVSIYNSEDLQELPIEILDLVQLPLSLLDQRLLVDGTIDYLHSKKIAIHARSLYLQGLLLTPASKWPNWISRDAINHQYNLEMLAYHNQCMAPLVDL